MLLCSPDFRVRVLAVDSSRPFHWYDHSFDGRKLQGSRGTRALGGFRPIAGALGNVSWDFSDTWGVDEQTCRHFGMRRLHLAHTAYPARAGASREFGGAEQDRLIARCA
jgi:hypothetical protein